MESVTTNKTSAKNVGNKVTMIDDSSSPKRAGESGAKG